MADGAREQDALALTVGDGVEGKLGELLAADHGEALAHDAPVLLREPPEKARVRVAPRLHDLLAGHALRLQPLGENDGEAGGKALVRERRGVFAVDVDFPAQLFELAGDALQYGRFARAVGADEGDDFAGGDADIDSADEHLFVVADG